MLNITKRKKLRVELRFTPTTLANYRSAAESVGISLNAWIMMSAASYYSTWTTPEQTRHRKKLPSSESEDKLCVVCGSSAESCKSPDKHKHSLWEEK